MKLRRYLLIVFILLILFASFLVLLDEEFYGHREGGSLWISAAIRTFNIYGMDAVHYLPIRTVSPTDPATGEYYVNHPPLLVWVNALGSWLFGYDEVIGAPYPSSLRLVAIFFTMPSLALVYSLARQFIGEKGALIAFVLYSFTPMTLIFSRTPYYDMLVMPMVLLYTIIFYHWMQKFSLWRTVSMMILALLIMWMAWVGAFFLLSLSVLALLIGNKQQRIWICIVGLVTVAGTLLIPILYENLHAGSILQLQSAFLFRSGDTVGNRRSASFSFMDFMSLWGKDMLIFVSPSITILGTLGLAYLLKRPKTLETKIILALAVAPLIFMLVFRNAFYFHDWYKIHFMPALSLAAAIFILRSWQLEAVGIKRYIKPFIAAICIVSFLLSIYWTVLLHLITFNPFARTLAAELPQHTEVTDTIASNITRPYPEVAFYAYRTIVWGIVEAEPEEFVESETEYYLYCFDTAEELEAYDGEFADFPYVVLADTCRLIHMYGD